MESREENHKLRLLLIQELHERELAENTATEKEATQSQHDQISDSQAERANKTTMLFEELRIKVVEQEETIRDFKREL